MKKLTNKLRSTGLAAALVISSSLLPSCGSNEPKDEALTGAGPVYTMQQQVFCLNMLSNISAHYNKNGNIQDSTVMAIGEVLADTGVIRLIGNWQCIWGPYVTTNKDGSTAQNTMYIAQRPGTDTFVVAIAGTDPSSAHDWLLEDADVSLVPWNDKDILHGFISGATYTGLTTLKNISGKDSSAQQVLAARVKSWKGGQIYVTGHSLGGALSPAYALHLADSMGAWVPGITATIHCLAVAGATPGDAAFAKYYNKQMGATTTRVWNTRDVVPHGFAEYMLAELDSLYPADSVSAIPAWLNATVDSLKKAVTLQNFTQLTPSTNDSFTSMIYLNDTMKHVQTTNPTDTVITGSDTSYLKQALFHHIPAYGVRFGTLSFQQAVQRVLNMPNPFFTEGGILVPVVDNGNKIQPY